MKCSRCFKKLPESEKFDYGTDNKGSVRQPHIHYHPFYQCLTCNKIYCITCWVKQQCKDMVYGVAA